MMLRIGVGGILGAQSRKEFAAFDERQSQAHHRNQRIACDFNPADCAVHAARSDADHACRDGDQCDRDNRLQQR